MKIKTTDQLSLYCETRGDPTSPPIMLVHGIGADHKMWKPQIESLPNAGYFVIVPDLRGHGVSGVPAIFRIADCAQDLRDILNDLDIQRAHFIGVSMGGMVVQQFIAQYPDRAISQIIVDSLSGISRPVERFNASLAALILKIFPPKLQASMIRNSYKKLGHADVGRYFEERVLHMDSRWLLAARQEVNRFTILRELPGMHIPTLVLVGDAFGKLAIDMARTTAEEIPSAQFQILQGGGDPSNLLVPEEFDETILAFLRSTAKNS